MAKDLYLSEGRVMGPDGQLDLATAFPNDPVVNATSSALLASHQYSPATVVVVNTTSSTFADVDATNMAITFTVPASGSVIVAAAGEVQAGSGSVLCWNLRQGAADVANTIARVAYGSASTVGVRANYRVKITGLTPEASVTYKLGQARAVGAEVCSTRASDDADAGPLLMEVWEVPF